MTVKQQSFLESLEIYLAKLVHDGHNEEAEKLAPIIELMYSLMAYLQAEASGFDERTLKLIKDYFDLRI